MIPPYNVWMGYDPREDLAYQVARHSILSRTDPKEVDVIPLTLRNPVVQELLVRPIEVKDGKLWCPISQAHMATEFAISRFVVPFIQQDGWCLFMDSDTVTFTDIRELFAQADDRYAVMCVKHLPRELLFSSREFIKMDGQVQQFYVRKNWSSVMLINCYHPGMQRFTLKDLNERPGRDLHAFYWLKDEEIGELEHKWNVLVGVDDMNQQKCSGIWHYTLGAPFIPGWKAAPFDAVWNGARLAMDSDRACKTGAQEEAPDYGRI